MKNFKELDKRKVEEVEESILQGWKKEDILNETIENRKNGKTWVFYDGPIYANAKPGIHHVLAKTIKDSFCKYHTMKGERVLRKIGLDTHGLPIEVNVEKKLGFKTKADIEAFGVENFCRECNKATALNIDEINAVTDKMGQFIDCKHPYVTCTNEYIESEWWIIKEMDKKGLLYHGNKVLWYCPRCGTELSQNEVSQGYEETSVNTVIVPLKRVDADEYFLAWTTTPWTLLANVAICVNPNLTYVKVLSQGYKFILAESLANKVLGDDYEVLETYKGSELVGIKYEQLMPFAKVEGKAFEVIHGDYVTLTDGTGIVHIAPAYGEDDSLVAKKNGIAFVNLVDKSGNFVKEVEPWAGRFVRDCNEDICKWLTNENKLFSKEKHVHSYPHCWRCDTPLIYYARDTWFIKMTAVRDKLVKNNDTVNWIPESIGKGRFGDWLKNVQDWGLSRNRYWGTPLNIWECECGCRHAIGSKEELRSMSDNCPEDIELHRPFIDAVTIKCPECGKQMHRVTEVIDCWFDSGSMPFAQWHYPFENQDIFEKHFPADFISEAVDQTRGWFYSLLAISTLLFNKAPYENVIVLGHVQDADGQKMSKSKGNAVDPFDALQKHGADAIRWYFYENSAPWVPNRFKDEWVSEGQRKFMGTLWNTYAFFVLYANIDDFDATKYALEYDKLSVMDKWLLSKLNTLIKTVDNHLANYQIPEAARALQDFVDDMSNWYVRRSRERFWAKGMEQDKINAYMTLYTALVEICKTAAPMIPFMTEEIYQNLVRSVDESAPESIHLCDFPVVNEAHIDTELEANMDNVLKLVVMGRACRNTANIKNRQPIGQMYVKADFEIPEFYKDIVKDELNVKNVTFTQDVRDFTSYTFKPQLKTVGPKYGKMLGGIKAALENLEGNAAMDELNTTGVLKLDVNGQEIELFKEDLLIDTAQIEGYESVNDNGITVVLDTNLTPELLEEGFVREIISKIQTMRKEADFEVMDKIRVTYEGSEKAEAVFEKNSTLIGGEVLATEVVKAEPAGHVKEWKINGEAVTMGVEKKGE